MLWQGDGWGPVPGWQPGSLLQKPRPGVTPAKISRLCAVPIAGSSCCSDPPWPPPKSSPERNRWEKSLGLQKNDPSSLPCASWGGGWPCWGSGLLVPTGCRGNEGCSGCPRNTRHGRAAAQELSPSGREISWAGEIPSIIYKRSKALIPLSLPEQKQGCMACALQNNPKPCQSRLRPFRTLLESARAQLVGKGAGKKKK